MYTKALAISAVFVLNIYQAIWSSPIVITKNWSYTINSERHGNDDYGVGNDVLNWNVQQFLDGSIYTEAFTSDYAWAEEERDGDSWAQKLLTFSMTFETKTFDKVNLVEGLDGNLIIDQDSRNPYVSISYGTRITDQSGKNWYNNSLVFDNDVSNTNIRKDYTMSSSNYLPPGRYTLTTDLIPYAKIGDAPWYDVFDERATSEFSCKLKLLLFPYQVPEPNTLTLTGLSFLFILAVITINRKYRLNIF